MQGYLAVGEIRPHPRNPRDHDPAENERRAREIVRTTWGAPILVQASTRRIIDGHGRWESAKLILAGLDVDGVTRGGPDWCFRRGAPAGLVPVSILDVDDATADALRVMANAEGLQGRDDPTKLLEMLSQFDRGSALLDDMGFTSSALDALAAEARAAVDSLASTPAASNDAPRAAAANDESPATVTEDEPEIDRADELQAKWQTAPGQLWEIGAHRLLCGDCRNPQDVDRLLGGRVINVAFTSPPYASQRTYDSTSGFKPIAPDEYVAWFELVQANVRARLTPDGSWFVNIKEHCDDAQRALYVKDLTLAHVRTWRWRFVDEFCWRNTKNGVPGAWPNRFKNAWEPVFHFCVERAIKMRADNVGVASDAVFSYSSDNVKSGNGSGLLGGDRATGFVAGLARHSNVIEAACASSVNHPAAFPVNLPAFFIQAFSDPADAIFDPFMGSGTTMVAADQTKRVAFGMELSPKYVAVALERMATMGLSPRLVAA